MISNFNSYSFHLSDGIILLHGFDECLPESRAQFLRYAKEISEISEERLKIIITSEKPHVLLDELDDWFHLDLDTLGRSTPPLDGDENAQEIVPSTIYSAMSDVTAQPIKNHLRRLASMESDKVRLVKQLLQAQRNWPQALSPRHFGRLVYLLERINPTDSPAQILDKVLRYQIRFWGFGLIFSWLLLSARPLTVRELAALLCSSLDQNNDEQPKSSSRRRKTVDRWRLKESETQVRECLQGIADFDHDQVRLTSEVRDIIRNTSSSTESYLWRSILSDGYVKIIGFCFEALMAEDGIRELESLRGTTTTRAIPIRASNIKRMLQW